MLAVLAYAAVTLLIASFHISAPSLGAPHAMYESAEAPVLITEPHDGLAPVLAMINNASSSVDLVMYELQDIDVENALVAAQQRGVDVRVLLNDGYYGATEKANQNAYQFLQSHNVPVHWTPAYFALTHQKTMAVDGKTALIMTFNFTPQYYASSRDFGIVDTDAKDVAAIEGAFNDDWNNKQDTAGSGDDLIWSPGASDQTLALIASAKSSIDIYNEEMNDQQVTDALVAAAKRGVTVRVVMTFQSSWRSAFQELVAVGAQVHTFPTTAPVDIHAKMILVDGDEVFLGSQNFSPTSLNNNRELGVFLNNPAVLSSLEKTFYTDFQNATPFSN